MKTTKCPFCKKDIVYSRDNRYLHCEDTKNCPYIIDNLCKVCKEGKYIYKVASHGLYKGVAFFQCDKCKSILDNTTYFTSSGN